MRSRRIQPAVRRRPAARGFGIAAMAIALVIIQLVVVAVVIGGARDLETTVQRADAARAFYMAEGAMNMAVREIVEYADDDNDGTAGGISDDGNPGDDPTLGSAKATVTRTETVGATLLTANGRSGNCRVRLVAGITDGMRAGRRVIYSQWANQAPQFRVWNGAMWGAPADTVDMGGKQYWAVIRRCPVRDEVISACSLQLHELQAAVQTGPTWGNLLFATSDCGTVNSRPFGFAYEQLSGNGLLAYRKSGSGPTIFYRIWDGTAWSAETSLASPLTGDATFIKLVPKTLSNEIMLYVLDSNSDLAAMVWNGASFGNSIVLDATAGASNHECVDAAYEHGTGRCVVAWGRAGTNFPQYTTWTGSAWLATSTMPNLGNVAQWIHLASDPTSNKLMIGLLDANGRINLTTWTGSFWKGYLQVTPNASTTESRCFDVAFQSRGTIGLAMWGHAGAPAPRYRLYDGNAWGAVTNAPSLPDQPLLIQLTPDGGGRGIMTLININAGQNRLEFFRWNGSSFVNFQELEPNVSGPSGAEVFMVPDEPPVQIPQQVNTWTESAPIP